MKAVFEKVIDRFDDSNFVIDRDYHHVRYVEAQSRASLVPAAAVTPAGRATDNFVAVETFVVAVLVWTLNVSVYSLVCICEEMKTCDFTIQWLFLRGNCLHALKVLPEEYMCQ